MANEVLQKTGTQIVFADHAGDFSPTAANDLQQGTPTDVEMDMASVANDAARQSVKVDLGATRAAQYSVVAALEFAASGLTAGNVVEFYWAASPDATAANGNPGGVSGSNAAYSGYSSNLDDSLRQLELIGIFVVTGQATTTVQVSDIGRFSPRERYGSLVMVNRSGAAMHTDDVEMHVALTPVVDEVQ